MCIRDRNFESARMAMDRKGIDPAIVAWYGKLLKGRKITADLQGEKCERIPARGSPQGGVLSPLIWNLIMDTLLATFQGDPVKVVGYADDILLMVLGPDRGTLIDIMNEALERVLTWGYRNG